MQGQIITEYEKEKNKEDYEAKLEDTTINYFYALYILSRCDAFLCSGQCNGWDNVLSLNGGNPIELWTSLIGEKRANAMYRCKTMWDTGAMVTWSSDEVAFSDFKHWSPYLAMEVGMTRWINPAKQLGIDASKGSIETGKDADFLVFGNDLLTAEHEGFSYNEPRDVYFGGIKMN